jgi:hypothetical protein
MPHTEYKVISGYNAVEFERALTTAAIEGWKPILLTSASAGGAGYQIVAILQAEFDRKG